eukprot:scaffold20550_cov127-Isochrysis_galbana.AAC.3
MHVRPHRHRYSSRNASTDRLPLATPGLPSTRSKRSGRQFCVKSLQSRLAMTQPKPSAVRGLCGSLLRTSPLEL